MTHHTLDYDEFTILMKNKEYNKINFKEREMQKYYSIFAISENNNLDNPSLKKNFFNLTNTSLNLSIVDLSRIRNKVLDQYKNLDFENLLLKLVIEDSEISIKFLDIKYVYNKNDEEENREQRIILFGLKESFDNKIIEEINTHLKEGEKKSEMNYINIDEDIDLNKYANSSKKNDDIEDLLIGSAYLDDLNGERHMDSYFQIPFKERLKKEQRRNLIKR